MNRECLGGSFALVSSSASLFNHRCRVQWLFRFASTQQTMVRQGLPFGQFYASGFYIYSWPRPVLKSAMFSNERYPISLLTILSCEVRNSVVDMREPSRLLQRLVLVYLLVVICSIREIIILPNCEYWRSADSDEISW